MSFGVNSGPNSGGKSSRVRHLKVRLITEKSEEIELLRQKVSDLAMKSPEKAATILSDWISKTAFKDDSINKNNITQHKKRSA